VSQWRLLADWEVIGQMNQLPVKTRRALRQALSRIVESPDSLSHYREANPRGIPIEVHVYAGYAIKYWIDFPDRHVKVLGLESAD
jgi:hypothetical protein